MITRRMLVIILISILLQGCGFVSDGPFGWVVTNTKTPISKGEAKNATKVGSACVYSFFGMITMGDGSIETAMRSGAITEIYTIDKDNLNIIGAFSRQCTVVLGN
ncbi:MAG: TRL-like family protein [Candidatus Magnetoovum sp. WYHC-5]|nr:TRL-like family protein [Candidatus Magnetoovum sp. WYHC-5]